MRYLSLPQSELTVSAVCLGTGGFGSDISRETSFAILDAFFERGGNFADSAHVYAAWIPGGGGASERTLGAWMRERGVRNRFIVGTKGGHPDLATMHISRLSPAEITQDLHESLDRLGTDTIDLYWLHRDDPAVPVDEILGVLNEHLAAGLIRAIGASNWSPARLEEARRHGETHRLKPFCASQIGWSLAEANPELQGQLGMRYMDEPTMDYHESSRLPVVAFSSQAMGFFSGKFGPEGQGMETPKGQGLARYYGLEENFKRLGRAGELAARWGCTLNQVALAYLFSQRFAGCGIVGSRSVEQAVDSCGAGDLTLSPEEVAFLEGRRAGI
jgi:aryl-alcohol dehydrogenase-like predicted oxidoreductase